MKTHKIIRRPKKANQAITTTQRETMMNKNQEVLLLNNQGVAYLYKGKVNEACSLFTRASQLFGLSGNNESQRRRTMSPFGYNWIDLSASYISCLADRKLISAESLPFLFLQAVQITDCTDIIDFEDQRWAVLYNLALSCHLLACENGEMGSLHRKRAHDLYGIVLNNFMSQTPVEHRSILTLALFNNAGCIYRENAMHDAAEVCVGKVKEILVRLPHEKRGINSKAFGLNVMVLERHELAGAA